MGETGPPGGGQLGVRSLGTAPPATVQPAWGQGPSGEAAREQAEGWGLSCGLALSWGLQEHPPA